MSNKVKFQRYDIIAIVKGQDVIYYKEFGEYHGDWLLISYDNNLESYFFYKGHYGSCSGCDEFEHWRMYNDEEIEMEWDKEKSHWYKLISIEKAKEFFDKFAENNYEDTKPFLIVDRNVMSRLVINNKVKEILPINFRFYFYYEENDETIFREIEEAIKNHIQTKNEKNKTNPKIQTK
jgi:hypothetical protein